MNFQLLRTSACYRIRVPPSHSHEILLRTSLARTALFRVTYLAVVDNFSNLLSRRKGFWIGAQFITCLSSDGVWRLELVFDVLSRDSPAVERLRRDIQFLRSSRLCWEFILLACWVLCWELVSCRCLVNWIWLCRLASLTCHRLRFIANVNNVKLFRSLLEFVWCLTDQNFFCRQQKLSVILFFHFTGNIFLFHFFQRNSSTSYVLQCRSFVVSILWLTLLKRVSYLFLILLD